MNAHQVTVTAHPNDWQTIVLTIFAVLAQLAPAIPIVLNLFPAETGTVPAISITPGKAA